MTSLNSHFYVSLPSNSSEKYYGKQPMNHYMTKLPHPIELDVEEWEVGLSEIIYPYSWSNLRKVSKVCIGISDLQLDDITNEYTIYEEHITLQISHYMTVQDLVLKLNRRIENTLNKIKEKTIPTINDKGERIFYGINEKWFWMVFRYDENVGKVYLSGNEHVYISLPSELGQMMGFGDMPIVIGSENLCPQIQKKKHCVYNTINCITFKYPDEEENDIRFKHLKSPFVADVHRGFTSLYVYSPIVTSQFVGVTLAPLLRVVSITGKFGETVNVRYDNIYYLPLAQSRFDQLEVYIRDDAGNYIPFNTGRVTVVLHFRKKSA